MPAGSSLPLTSRSLGHRAPLLWLVLPFIGGLAAARMDLTPPLSWQLGLALPSACLAVAGAWRAPRLWAPALAVAMFFAGSASFTLKAARVAGWASLPPREARLSLRIDRVFAAAEGRRTVSGLATITRAAGAARELVGRRVSFSLNLRPGDEPPIRSAVVTAGGVLTPLPADPAPNSFDGYLASAGVYFRLARGRILAVEKPPTRYHQFLEQAAGRLNTWLAAGISAKRPDLAAVFRAMMLGQKTDLTSEQGALFKQSGTMHLFAINGLHIGVVALSLHALLAMIRCPRALAAVVTLAVLWLDVDTTGASPSAVRAFLLVACYEAAFVLRRPGNGLAALSAAALIVLLLDPTALFSASFQMSYGVVLAILCLGLPLSDWMQQKAAPFRDLPEATWSRGQRAWAAVLRWFWPMFGIGISAAVVSAISGPAFFEVFAPGGFFANLVLVPLATVVIVAGFASVVAGVVGATCLCALFNHAALVVLVLIDALIRVGVHVPATWWPAHWRLAWAAPLALAIVLGCIIAGYALGWRRERGGWWPPFVVVAAALAIGVKFG